MGEGNLASLVELIGRIFDQVDQRFEAMGRRFVAAVDPPRVPLYSVAPASGFIGNPMSIYATLWTLRFPSEGDVFSGCEWIDVTAQGVPPHIGSPTPDAGYEKGDPYAAFLPPPVAVDADGGGPFLRAVVFVTKSMWKGTDRSPQEYQNPLLVLSGEEYARITFVDLHDRICAALRGDRAPVIAEIFRPDGSITIFRQPPDVV